MAKAKRGSKGRRKPAPKAAQADFRETRKKVKNIVSSMAPEMARAVAVDVKSKAQVQSMKVLFELVGLFPETAEEREAAGDHSSLARTLLDRLGLDDDAPVSEEEAREQKELEASARAVMAENVPVK
jgi:hypothetical protein